jgi:hypothetical protein
MSSQFLFANNAGSTLAGGISSGATTLAVSPGQGALFPSPAAGQQFAVTLISATNILIREIVYCTARSTDTFTIVRAQEGTTALAWNAGDLVQNLNTAGTMASLLSLSNYLGVMVFASSGTWTVPLGVIRADVEVWGGGGGAGGAANNGGSAGGGGAGYTRGVFTVSPGATIAITVGSGGAGGIGAVAGSAGTSSSFGSFCSATGGGGGAFGNNSGTAGGGSYGIGTGGYNNQPGTGGGGSVTQAGGVGLSGGSGGHAFCSPGGFSTGQGATGPVGCGPGAGGGGTGAAAGLFFTGGAGNPGLVIVRW